MTDGPIRIALESEADRDGWRTAARALLGARVPPDAILWTVATRADAAELFGADAPSPLPSAAPSPALKVPRDLMAEIDTALLHTDPDRHALAYRLVWRAQREAGFHRNPADADVRALAALAKSVRRDIHKMHAFVRFRASGRADARRERYVAWFEPDHHITEAVAPFFRARFNGMDWLIVTPEASIAWDGKALVAGPGGVKSDVPQDDAVEEEWRAYYASIFNPARVKVAAMKKEMPVRYWRNLPEARLIDPLIADAGRRVGVMVEQQAGFPGIGIAPAAAVPARPRFDDLAGLHDALVLADDAPEADFSARVVCGEGPADARIMLVGEQPGDVEDAEGRPFVGPAGQMLDRALGEAGIDRGAAYVTNAVKRFKFVLRGKRRIHARPTNDEIDYYRWWLEEERRLVDPAIVVALGASAARALTGQSLTISRVRGTPVALDRGQLLITVHPSFLLRIPDEGGRAVEYGKFVRDLENVAALARAAARGDRAA